VIFCSPEEGVTDDGAWRCGEEILGQVQGWVGDQGGAEKMEKGLRQRMTPKQLVSRDY
jgi:hypothetical protein